MDRRKFAISAVLSGISCFLSAERCATIAPGVVGCRSEIDIDQVELAATLQHCPMWCWAASISAVFKFFDHDVDQEDIVRGTYGQLGCLPALRPIQIAQALSKSWTDNDGDRFRLRITSAYDPYSGINATNNAIIVNELNHNRPLIYCNTHHAMVVSAVDYRPTPMGPMIDGVGVIDPWPDSPRLHPLSRPEIVPVHLGGQMTFLASVNVVDI